MTTDFSEIVSVLMQKIMKVSLYVVWMFDVCSSACLHASEIKCCVCNVNILMDLTLFGLKPFKALHRTSRELFVSSKQPICVLLLLLHLFIARKSSSIFPFFKPVIAIHLPRSYEFHKNVVLLDITIITILQKEIHWPCPCPCPLLSRLPLPNISTWPPQYHHYIILLFNSFKFNLHILHKLQALIICNISCSTSIWCKNRSHPEHSWNCNIYIYVFNWSHPDVFILIT
jgi:hypothetical protein